MPETLFLSRTISATFKSLELTEAGQAFVEGLWGPVDVTFMPDAEEGHVALTTLGTLKIDLEGYDDRPCRFIFPKRFAERLEAGGFPFIDWPDQSTRCSDRTTDCQEGQGDTGDCQEHTGE